MMKCAFASLCVAASLLTSAFGATTDKNVPADAVVLFDGTPASLNANWSDGRGRGSGWRVVDGAVEATRGGDLCTRSSFGDIQLHCEWRTPARQVGCHPFDRGNSGIFLMGLYEVQIMESHGTDPANMTVPFYADGQAASIYGQNPPLVNPVRKPGEWQVYDIVFHAPRMEGGKVVKPADVTVFLNGVLVQDHWVLEGPTKHCRRAVQTSPGAVGPIRLQYHNCPVQYRNIWVRRLPSRSAIRVCK